jgi:hypothetical protein
MKPFGLRTGVRGPAPGQCSLRCIGRVRLCVDFCMCAPQSVSPESPVRLS